MDMRFDSAGAVESLTQADNPRICMDAHPKNIGELLRSQCFDLRNLHVPSSCAGPCHIGLHGNGLVGTIILLVIFHNMF